jgi:hypothetical protein
VTDQTRRHGPAAVSASVCEGDERSDSAKRAMPPMVRYCGGVHSWWRRISGVVGQARKRTMYAVMSSHPACVHPRDERSCSVSQSLRRTSYHLRLSSVRFFRCHTIQTRTVHAHREGVVCVPLEGFDDFGIGWLLASVLGE